MYPDTLTWTNKHLYPNTLIYGYNQNTLKRMDKERVQKCQEWTNFYSNINGRFSKDSSTACLGIRQFSLGASYDKVSDQEYISESSSKSS